MALASHSPSSINPSMLFLAPLSFGFILPPEGVGVSCLPGEGRRPGAGGLEHDGGISTASGTVPYPAAVFLPLGRQNATGQSFLLRTRDTGYSRVLAPTSRLSFFSSVSHFFTNFRIWARPCWGLHAHPGRERQVLPAGPQRMHPSLVGLTKLRWSWSWSWSRAG